MAGFFVSDINFDLADSSKMAILISKISTYDTPNWLKFNVYLLCSNSDRPSRSSADPLSLVGNRMPADAK